MSTTDPTAIERLTAFLNPPDSAGIAAQNEATSDPDIKEARERLQTALGKTEDEARSEIRKIATQFSDRLQFSPQDIDNAVGDYRRSQESTFDQPTQPPETPSQQQGSSLPGILQRNTPENPSTGIHTGTSGVPELVHSLQEQELLDAYDAALAIKNTPQHPNAREEAVQAILNNLDAHSVLKKQWETLNKHVQDYFNQPDVLESLATQGKKQLDKHASAEENEEAKKKGEELNGELLEAHASGDRERAHGALK